MANTEGHITPEALQKALNDVGGEVVGRAIKRVNAAVESLCVVRARSRFHLVLGRGATHALCEVKADKTPDTVLAHVSDKLLKSVCRKCWLRYRQLLDKAVRIEIDRL